MPKYIIERGIEGAGEMAPAELRGASQKSCDVLRDLGTEIQWIQSYVTGDKIYCVYYARDESLINEHARRSGFPADSISEVKAVIEPATAEG